MTGSAQTSCLLIGGRSLLFQCADELRSRGFRILGIISDDSDTKAYGAEHDLPVWPNDSALEGNLAGLQCDYLFSIVNLNITPTFVLEKAARFAINFHDGVLPDYAGLNVPVWALLAGETQHGVTWHEMTEQVDQGRIFVEKTFPIEPGMPVFGLNARCLEAGLVGFRELLDGLASASLEPFPQAQRPGTFFAASDRPRDLGFVDWNAAAETVVQRINALDFGGFADNPIACGKVIQHGEPLLVRSAKLRSKASGAAPGTVLESNSEQVTVAAIGGAVELTGLTDTAGEPVLLQPGERLASPPPSVDEEQLRDAARHERFWIRQLTRVQPLDLPDLARQSSATLRQYSFPLPPELSPEVGLATVAMLLARVTNRSEITLAFRAETSIDLPAEAYVNAVPVTIRWDRQASLAANATEFLRQAQRNLARGRFPRDLRHRSSELTDLPGEWMSDAHSVLFHHGQIKQDLLPPTCRLAVGLSADESALTCWCADEAWVERLAARLRQFQKEGLAGKSIGEASILSAEDRSKIDRFNQTKAVGTDDALIHQQIEAQASRHGDAVAIICEDRALTYAELNRRANQLAHYLIELGVETDECVGICLGRSELIQIAMLGILKAGAAYVPLDPAYPAERIRHMMVDSGMRYRVVDQASERDGDLSLTDLAADLDRVSNANPKRQVAPQNLAYVIYTSGSTGLPKGVKVEHRNVTNFFAGMDQRVDKGESGCWLSVTSMSFDISVLEMLWTLSRGMKVVLSPLDRAAGSAPLARDVKLSLFFWNHVNKKDLDHPEKYRLLLEAAKFADEQGFYAIWTPERHFGAFGGSYPNPAVTSAALATATRRIRIHAGSVVAPLHSPIRIAEDWSMVDNLSGGRVGVSFAAGWQPNDFAIRPEGFENAKQQMLDAIDTVQALWSGKTVSFPGPKGDVAVQTLPRPIQPSLPVWLTTAGNPESFRAAGERGVNLLTHLLGQSIEQVAENIAIYREAYKAGGHPGEGHVTLMLHTLVGEDTEEIKSIARDAMKQYLTSAMFLVKDAAWQFPTFKKMAETSGRGFDQVFADLSEQDLDALLDFAFERYFETSGLFGSHERCMNIIQQVSAAGVDEIGCLVDYGLDNETVLRHLPALSRLLEDVKSQPEALQPKTLSELAVEHGVTHLQCTPSQAYVLLAEDQSDAALRGLKHLMLGGEALPKALAQQIRQRFVGRLTNMYGPTETTIWSTTWDVPQTVEQILIGEPIVNTQCLVLDDELQPLPPGIPGELVIAGDGVVRGYHERPELNDERFVSGPNGDRCYRTGDLAIFDGSNLICLGRNDFQVKLRGYRIELGEIEATIEKLEGVEQAAVIMREEAQQLLGFYRGLHQADSTWEGELRRSLPDFMVPSQLIRLESFPTTPNGKVNRQALPSLAQNRVGSSVIESADSEFETRMVEIWELLLDRRPVGVTENFFEVGGHSLLAIKLQGQILDEIGVSMSITDIFQFPTIRKLAGRISEPQESVTADRGRSRAARRRRASRARV